MTQGRVIIYTGDGKGKTSAAFGSVLRASGHGWRTAVVQFIKGDWDYGESTAIKRLADVELIRIGSGFTWLAEDPDEPRALAQQALQVSQELALSDRYGLLVLDEINCAIAERLVAVESVVKLLEAKPARLSMIMTGRGAPPELVEAADTVTEMRCLKHAFEQGIPAQQGIEY